MFKQATKTHFVDFDDDRWVLPTLKNKKWMGSDFGQFQSLTLASWSRVNWFVGFVGFLLPPPIAGGWSSCGGKLPSDAFKVPSGNDLHSYWKLPFIVDLSIKKRRFSIVTYVSLPEGKHKKTPKSNIFKHPLKLGYPLVGLTVDGWVFCQQDIVGTVYIPLVCPKLPVYPQAHIQYIYIYI